VSIDPIKVLLVEDEPSDAKLIKALLQPTGESPGCVITHSRWLKSTLEYLVEGSFDLILLDLSLPDSQSLDTFKQVKKTASTLPIIILSQFEDESVALQAVRQGAQDYLVKGQINSPILVRAIRYAIERQKLLLALAASHQQQEQERELSQLEQLPTAYRSKVSSKLYGSVPLKESATDNFNQLVQQYSEVMDLALEQRAYYVTHPIPDKLREIAQSLGFLNAGPKDVIDIHTKALKQKIPGVHQAKAQAYLEESRLLVLELMGYLVAYYRKHNLPLESIYGKN